MSTTSLLELLKEQCAHVVEGNFPDSYKKYFTIEIATRSQCAKLIRNLPLPVIQEKRAPVQGYVGGIPWDMHLRAYDAYCKKWSPQPALIEGWCRGGFGTDELDTFIPGWREELSERTALLARIKDLETEIAKLRGEQ
ncbi:hypothetical protein [Undibacterium sp. TJN19]|uniref:hypothetical protein n=1 Tax=Undibacterium sp. TJN19 TaxID=3413055 RepID=UPI003BF21E75